jgi:Zn-dependent peptidase ImmA (M78 family)
LGFLLLKKPPELELPVRLFRTRGDAPIQNPSTELIDTLYAMERRQSWLRDYFIREGMLELSFVGSCQINDETASVTNRMREVLGLQQNWAVEYHNEDEAIKALRSCIEKAGVFVFSNGIVRNNTHRKLNSNEFLGFVMSDKYAPVIFINNADFKAAQIFTLAHEFAHLLFGISAAFDLDELKPANDPGEKACNAVAAEFLVPREALSQFRASLQQNDFQSAAFAFKVSEIVIARRALDSNIISTHQFFDFYNEYRERERSQPSADGGNFYYSQNTRVGKFFAGVLKKALGENKIMHREAYSLTGLYGKTFDNYLFES